MKDLLTILYARKRKLDRMFKKKRDKLNKTQMSAKMLKVIIEIDNIAIDLKETKRAINAIEKYHIENAIGGQNK